MSPLAVGRGFGPLTIGLTLVGFLVAWPLGLAVLAWAAWSDRETFVPRARAFLRGVGQGIRGGDCSCGPASALHIVPTRCAARRNADRPNGTAG